MSFEGFWHLVIRYLVFAHRKILVRFGLAIFWFLNNSFAANGTSYVCQIEPKLGENFSYGVFECWTPLDGVKLNAILCVVLYPRDSQGALLKEYEAWSKLARQHNCALIAASFAKSTEPTRPWGKAEFGSGRALLAAIEKFSELASCPELRSAPIVLAGVCQAGQYAHSFSAYAPERTAAFVTIGGGKHNLDFVRNITNVPALLICCSDRGEAAANNVNDLFIRGRKLNAPWAWENGLMSEYDQGKSSKTINRFLNRILKYLNEHRGTSKMPFSQGNVYFINDGQFASLKDIGTWFPRETKMEAPFQGLCFIGEPMPERATCYPAALDLGMLSFGESKPINFQVDARHSIVRRVFVADNTFFRDVAIKEQATGIWLIKGNLNLDIFDAGRFCLEIPVRFQDETQQIGGGSTIVVKGEIYGDVKVKPRSLFLGTFSKSGKTIDLALNSASHKSIQIIDTSNSAGTVQVIGSIRSATNTLHIKLHIIPKEFAGNKSVSGVLTLTVKSSEIRRIKLVYAGVLAEVR